MEALFLKLVNLGLAASFLVLAVSAARMLLRRAPKWTVCLLWALVALRLLCPVRLESAWSLIPSREPIPQAILLSPEPGIDSGITAVDEAVNPVISQALTPAEGDSANPAQVWTAVLAWVWLAGLLGMLGYGTVSYVRLRLRVRTAIPMEQDVKQSECIDTPFVLGVLRPRIFLPFSLPEADKPYVLAHERAHIARRDPFWRLLAYGLLSVYWFHPVLWLAYVLFCRDVESACDEKAAAAMSPEGRRAYSAALLHCAVPGRVVAACPLAFGESNVRRRIRGVLNYRKPAFYVVLLAVLALIAGAAAFLTDPVGEGSVEKMYVVYNHGWVTLSQKAQWRPILKMLDKIEKNAQVLDLNPEDLAEDHRTSWISVIGPEETRDYIISADDSMLWERNGSKVYSLEKNGDLTEYMCRISGAAPNGSTGRTAFASIEEPYLWASQLEKGDLSRMTVRCRPETDGFIGRVSLDNADGLLKRLNALPETAFVSLPLEPGTLQQDLQRRLPSDGWIVELGDRSNGLTALLRRYGGITELVLMTLDYNDWSLDPITEGAALWRVDDAALGNYLDHLKIKGAFASTVVGNGYNWHAPIEFTRGRYHMEISIPDTWIYELVEQPQGDENFGIRCRPGTESSGWLYFSFWPNGFPEALHSPYEHDSGSFASVQDSDGQTYTFLKGSQKGRMNSAYPWDYLRCATNAGDCVIRNENADQWLWEDYTLLGFIETLSAFTID